MNPYLTSQKHPRVNVLVELHSHETIDCLMDTGFSGGISLPLRYRKNFTRKAIAFQEYELADGSRVTFDLYEITVSYRKTSKMLLAFFTNGDDPLVGIEFLDGFRFILDLKKSLVTLD